MLIRALYPGTSLPFVPTLNQCEGRRHRKRGRNDFCLFLFIQSCYQCFTLDLKLRTSYHQSQLCFHILLVGINRTIQWKGNPSGPATDIIRQLLQKAYLAHCITIYCCCTSSPLQYIALCRDVLHKICEGYLSLAQYHTYFHTPPDATQTGLGEWLIPVPLRRRVNCMLSFRCLLTVHFWRRMRASGASFIHDHPL